MKDAAIAAGDVGLLLLLWAATVRLFEIIEMEWKVQSAKTLAHSLGRITSVNPQVKSTTSYGRTVFSSFLSSYVLCGTLKLKYQRRQCTPIQSNPCRHSASINFTRDCTEAWRSSDEDDGIHKAMEFTTMRRW
ncbi:hypothetical protein PV325_002718 [Microctonus aethiopoides]|nr:hypothetical protein PV325_002718 [Microctonus aethiopoides]KAK0092155.1 hypothetical protein PV326_002074 [Microctonus aethiopoides]